jgi:glycosyltransferase involved in cell wall biosynthesis
MARVSVIIPTYCRPKLLPQAVRSAFAAGADVEVIVVDDGSTDETAQVCRELRGIKYVRLERNQGVAGARNLGVMHSEGEYISFLDDDDVRLPRSFDLQAQLLDENRDAGFTCGGMLMADQNYHLSGEIVYPREASGDVFWKILELDFPVMGLSALIRKECLLRVGLLDRNAIDIDDWDIFVRLAELFPVITTPEPVGIYRQPTWNSGQGSSARAKQLRHLARHQRRLLKLPRVAALNAGERRAIRHRTADRIADTLLWGAYRLVSNRELLPVFRNVAVALRLSPFRLFQPGPYKKLAARLAAAQASPATVVKYEQIFGLLDS